MFTAIIFDIVYGVRVYSPEDHYIWLSKQAMTALDEGTLPGAFWVESFPWLKHIPAWLPGSSARRFADKYRTLILAARDEAFATAKDAHIAVSSLLYQMSLF